MFKKIFYVLLFCMFAMQPCFAQTYIGTITQSDPVYVYNNNGSATNVNLVGSITNAGSVLIIGGNALTTKDAGGNITFSVNGANGVASMSSNLTVSGALLVGTNAIGEVQRWTCTPYISMNTITWDSAYFKYTCTTNNTWSGICFPVGIRPSDYSYTQLVVQVTGYWGPCAFASNVLNLNVVDYSNGVVNGSSYSTNTYISNFGSATNEVVSYLYFNVTPPRATNVITAFYLGVVRTTVTNGAIGYLAPPRWRFLP